MNLQKAEQAIVNAIYAAIAWLALDFGLLLQEHGGQAMEFLADQPEMAAGAIIAAACIVGLFYKSRFAAIVLFLIFLLPLVLRMVQGSFPPVMFLIFSLILLYFFLAGVIGTFSYHVLKNSDQVSNQSD
jgi:K+-sensing histidine kinase KdpD